MKKRDKEKYFEETYKKFKKLMKYLFNSYKKGIYENR